MQTQTHTDYLNALEITPKPFQEKYLYSEARYPAFIAGWGTGKTLFAILRGLLCSEEVGNNLGLIVRKEFTDLRDSTIKDFENYTGLEVNSQKEAVLPGGSIIMFRHGAELDVLKNINLGWFLIEQAEEFETNEQFEFLRGRLRRANIPFHTGFIIGNVNGHNWIWKLWKNNPPSKEYELIEATTWDNQENLPKDYIEDLRQMMVESPNHYRRFVMNDWEEQQADDYLFTTFMLEEISTIQIEGESSIRILSADIARFGEDETVFTILERKGSYWEQIHLESHRHKDLMWTVGRFVDLKREFRTHWGVVDDDALGGGVTDRLKELGLNIEAFRGGKEPKDKERFYNRRSENYFRLKEMIENKRIKILSDEVLKDQLLTIRYKYHSKGQKIILSKDELKKEGIKSPDKADALMMAMALTNKSIEKEAFVPETRKAY